MLVYSTKRNKMEPIKTVPVSAAVKYNQNLRLLLISMHYILKKNNTSQILTISKEQSYNDAANLLIFTS